MSKANRKTSLSAPLAKPSAVTTAIRARQDAGYALDGNELELLDVLDVAEQEAVPTLLMCGGLLSFHSSAAGLPEAIARVMHKSGNDVELEQCAELCEALDTKAGNTEASDMVWGMYFEAKRAAFCLGLAIGRRLA